MCPADAALDGSTPDCLAIRCCLHDAMLLEHIEHGGVAIRYTGDTARQKMSAEPVTDGLTHEPQRILSEPAVGGLGLVQAEHLPYQVAQAVEELTLQGLLWRFFRLGRVAAEVVGHRRSIGLNDKLAEQSGMLVSTSEHVQQCRPELWIAAEPIQDRRIEHIGIKESCRSAVQPV